MAITKAAVVQLSITSLIRYSRLELHKKLTFLFYQGIEAGADIVIFPALTGLLFAPEAQKVLEYGIDDKTVQLVWRLGAYWTAEWLDFFRELAQKYRVFVVPGTNLESTPPTMWHRGYLLAPNGSLLLSQDQIHFTAEELVLGFEPGGSLSVGEIDQLRLGMLLGQDTWVPEVSRILALQGAQLLISLQANSSFYDYRKQLAGGWQAAQSNRVFVTESCLVGKGAKTQYQGLSGIFGPAQAFPPLGILAHIDPLLTNQGSLDLGYLISPQKEKEGVLIRNMDFGILRRAGEQERVFSGFNYLLYNKELSLIYSDLVESGGVEEAEGE